MNTIMSRWPRKRIQFSGELVEINSVRLECSGIFEPDYGSASGGSEEYPYIDDLKVRSLDDKQDIYDILDLEVIDKICNQLVDQVEEPYQEKED